MRRLYAIVSCDVVDSTSLQENELLQLRRAIYADLFSDLALISSDFWGRVVRGDTIESCIDEPWYAFRIAILMKCWFKKWAFGHDASHFMKECGIRYSIGIGTMRIVNKREDFLDGEAIYIAGRNLDYIYTNGYSSMFGISSENADIESLITTNLRLIDNMIDSFTERQCLVIYYKLLGWREVEIAKELSASQAAVNLRAKSAGWKLIRNAIGVLEKIKFEDYVD